MKRTALPTYAIINTVKKEVDYEADSQYLSIENIDINTISFGCCLLFTKDSCAGNCL